MTPVQEDQLRDLLRRAAPDTAAISFDAVVQRAQRRRIAMTLAAAAAVAGVIAGTVAGIALIVAHSGGERHTTPAHHQKSSRDVLVPAVPTHAFGPATPLPADVHVTSVTGPEYLGAVAFGDIWATGGSGRIGSLYRLSSDNTRVLSRTNFYGVSAGREGPVQVGHAIAVLNPSGNAYNFFNENGQSIGRPLPELTHGAITGDSTGGWAATKFNQVSRLDATGIHVVRRLDLAVSSIDGLAISPGLLWVIDASNNQLVRVNSSTGAVTGRLTLPATPTQVAYIDHAVYVASADYGLRRIDPATMTVTAAIFSRPGQSSPVIAHAPNGQLWAQADAGTVAQLDPLSLRVERNIRVYPTADDPAIGAVITASRIFVGDTKTEIHSFPSR